MLTLNMGPHMAAHLAQLPASQPPPAEVRLPTLHRPKCSILCQFAESLLDSNACYGGVAGSAAYCICLCACRRLGMHCLAAPDNVRFLLVCGVLKGALCVCSNSNICSNISTNSSSSSSGQQ